MRAQAAPLSLPGLLQAGKPLLMGVLNVTPDSFYDGGAHFTRENALHHALALAEAGAAILDVGGESTRPGSESVSVAQELERVLPVIEAVAARVDIPISIDTSKAAVAEAALAAGARIVNDISAGTADTAMFALCARAGCPLILMHMKGTPKDMQSAPRYNDVAAEVWAYLAARLAEFRRAGGDVRQLLVDPGIGFGKNLDQNLELLRALPALAELAPVVVGVSRKSFLGRLSAGQKPGQADLPIDQVPPPAARLAGSLAAAVFAAERGAAVLRVHDVAETREALRVWKALEAVKR